MAHTPTSRPSTLQQETSQPTALAATAATCLVLEVAALPAREQLADQTEVSPKLTECLQSGVQQSTRAGCQKYAKQAKSTDTGHHRCTVWQVGGLSRLVQCIRPTIKANSAIAEATQNVTRLSFICEQNTGSRCSLCKRAQCPLATSARLTACSCRSGCSAWVCPLRNEGGGGEGGAGGVIRGEVTAKATCTRNAAVSLDQLHTCHTGSKAVGSAN
jgi:hypothetical protein